MPFTKKNNKEKSVKVSHPLKDDNEENDEKTFQLSRSRFLTVSEFRNKIRVDIREYYFNEDGERKPGKKGISLSMEEWGKIMENMEKIKKAIKGEESSDSPLSSSVSDSD